MVWPTIDELVIGWVQRSYLKEYRWWLQLITDEFAFLAPLGYSLPRSDVAGVKFHQKGNYVWFHGPGRDVVIEYDPESSFLDAVLWEEDGSDAGRFIPLDAVLLAVPPAVQPPSRVPLDRPAIEANVRWWANGLRAAAQSLLGLESPARDIHRH